MKPLGPCDILLCIEKGRDPAVSTDDTDPLLRELWDERRDPVEGVGGRGFSSSLLNSLNSLSRPGCICRAIIQQVAERLDLLLARHRRARAASRRRATRRRKWRWREVASQVAPGYQRGGYDWQGLVGTDQGARDVVDEPWLGLEGVWVKDGVAEKLRLVERLEACAVSACKLHTCLGARAPLLL
jgi:hypothetical protein